ncbi:MAG: cadherin-like beta sandwich domain-containing protein, partial [Bacillota bacterium]|nr:cadherin-like beta sandwich domain-containing protein [Bacillota bacterium]
MLKKVSIGKGVSIVLVISMFGMGAPSLPSVYASGEDNTSQVSVQNEQKAPVNVLSNLEIEGTTLDQTFLPDLYKYTATVENNVQSITLLASSSVDEKAAITITVNGQTVEDPTKPILLQTGDNQIAIKVDDGVNAANTYNLTITRKKSSNNLLQDIQLSNGELSPKFDAAVTSYSVQVANDVNEITVSPVAAENTASILVNDSPVTDKGVSVQLSADKTEITIVVTAENGEKKTYSMEVTKASAASVGAGTGTSNSSSGSTGNKRPSNLSTAGFSQGSNKNAGLT